MVGVLGTVLGGGMRLSSTAMSSIAQQIEALFNPHDIRGVWGQGLTEQTVRAIVRAAVQVLPGEEDAIVLGRDGRLSSPDIHAIAVEEITRAGLGLVDVGETSTEVVYHTSGFFRLPGIMITASHNPSLWNGFKFCGPLAGPIGKETGLWAIRELAAANNLPEPKNEPGPISQESEMSTHYAKTVRAISPFSREASELTIVIDAANGMANVVAPTLFDGLNVIWLANKIDGRFPDHEPNPLKSKNLANLIDTMQAEQADLGMAFDGDADRLILVTESGQPVPPALAQAHIARLMINRFSQPGHTPVVLYSEVSSQIVPMVIEAAGGKAIQTPVGHSAIKSLMAQHEAIGAVEHSGHYYFGATYRADSAMLAAAMVIEDLAQAHRHKTTDGTPVTFSQRLADLPKWVMAEEENWIIEDISHAYATVHKEIQHEAQALLGGGVAYQDPHWRATLRPSNTEPLLRFNIEADHQALLDELQARFQTALTTAGAHPEGQS